MVFGRGRGKKGREDRAQRRDEGNWREKGEGKGGNERKE